MILHLAMSLGLTLSPTMAGPPVAAKTNSASAPDYFASLFASEPATECACANVTMSDATTVTTTRASTAYCTASTGTMTSCANNLPRVSNSGVLIEGSRTNLSFRSESLNTSGPWFTSNATVTADQASAPWGGTTMDTVATSNVSGSVFQTVTTASSVGPYAFSAFGKALSGTNASTMLMRCTGSTPATCTCTRESGGVCTAAIVSADCKATATYSTTTDRVRGVVTCNAAVTGPLLILSGGEFTVDTDSQYWSGIQLEESSAYASSYVATAGTAVARSADSVSFTPGQAVSTAGCISGTVTFNAAPVASARLIGGAVATGIFVVDADTVRIGDGTNTVSVDPGTLASQAMAFRAGWTGTSLSLTVNGVTATGTFDGDMDFGTIYLGSQAGSSNFLGGYLKNIKLGTSSTGCQ